MRLIFLLLLITMIIGCTTNSRYQMSEDKAPTRLPTTAETSDIEPRYEPYSRGGNIDYTIRGIQYQILKDATNYIKVGNASWYGEKFHGHLTSNGEIYNMYTLSAAHKTLPIPSFVKVTNLANDKEVIVRVNDRGPFHPDRIIDLSYGAAHRLDMLNLGTARVKLEVLTFSPQLPTPTVETSSLNQLLAVNQQPQKCIIQLAATSNKLNAQRQLSLVAAEHQISSQLEQAGGLFRMLLGPITKQHHCAALLKKVTHNYPKAFIKML